jgi:hypothetical protein
MSGRTPREIDADVLDAMIQYGATCTDCAGRFNCSNDTIVRFIKDKYSMNFADYSDKMMFNVRMKLRDRMFRAAMEGNTAMMIWLSKQWLNMSDNPGSSISKDDARKVFELAYRISKEPDNGVK